MPTGTAAVTANASTGFPNPFSCSAPSGSASTIVSTSASTRWLTTICPGSAASQSRDAADGAGVVAALETDAPDRRVAERDAD